MVFDDGQCLLALFFDVKVIVHFSPSLDISSNMMVTLIYSNNHRHQIILGCG